MNRTILVFSSITPAMKVQQLLMQMYAIVASARQRLLLNL